MHLISFTSTQGHSHFKSTCRCIHRVVMIWSQECEQVWYLIPLKFADPDSRSRDCDCGLITTLVYRNKLANTKTGWWSLSHPSCKKSEKLWIHTKTYKKVKEVSLSEICLYWMFVNLNILFCTQHLKFSMITLLMLYLPAQRSCSASPDALKCGNYIHHTLSTLSVWAACASPYYYCTLAYFLNFP